MTTPSTEIDLIQHMHAGDVKPSPPLYGITEYDTHCHFIGSGALSYPWYSVIEDAPEYSEDKKAYDGWFVRFTDGDKPRQEFTLNHAAIMWAVKRIIVMELTGNRPEYIGGETIKNCFLFLGDLDSADFDAATADNVMQIAAFGKIIYG